MRIALVLTFTLIAAPVLGAANLPGMVFQYECKQIDPAKDGFSCKMDTIENQTHMNIHFVEDVNKLPANEKERKTYRYNALVLRYFDLGGKHFYITYNWKPKLKKSCKLWKGQRYSYTCE